MRIQTLMCLELETLIALKNRTRALSWHQILAGSHGKDLSTNQRCPWQQKPWNKQLFPISNQLELVYSFHTEFQNTLSYYNPAQRWQIQGLLMPPKQPDFARCQTQGTALTNVSSVLFHRGGDDVATSCSKKSFPSSCILAVLGFIHFSLPGCSSSHLLLSKSCVPGGVLVCCECQRWRVRTLSCAGCW